jgi:hypothetical protein
MKKARVLQTLESIHAGADSSGCATLHDLVSSAQPGRLCHMASFSFASFASSAVNAFLHIREVRVRTP